MADDLAHIRVALGDISIKPPLLDRMHGEKLSGMGDEYIVVPASKWKDSPFWQIAYTKAIESFAKAGAMHPIHIDEDQVLVQEYHGPRPAIAFIFGRDIAGEPHYHPHVFDLSKKIIADLEATGRWKTMRKH